MSAPSHQNIDYIKFNNANYLAVVRSSGTTARVHLSMFDVTNPSRITTPTGDPGYSSFQVYTSEAMTGTTNTNGTGDLAYGYSPDGERMQVYMLLTNGGIMAHEFTRYAP